jgi:hypothetical protein
VREAIIQSSAAGSRSFTDNFIFTSCIRIESGLHSELLHQQHGGVRLQQRQVQLVQPVRQLGVSLPVRLVVDAVLALQNFSPLLCFEPAPAQRDDSNAYDEDKLAMAG